MPLPSCAVAILLTGGSAAQRGHRNHGVVGAPLAKDAPSLTLRRSTPHSMVDSVVEGVLKARFFHRARSTDSLGHLNANTVAGKERGWRLESAVALGHPFLLHGQPCLPLAFRAHRQSLGPSTQPTYSNASRRVPGTCHQPVRSQTRTRCCCDSPVRLAGDNDPHERPREKQWVMNRLTRTKIMPLVVVTP